MMAPQEPTDTTQAPQPVEAADMALLVGRVREFLADRESAATLHRLSIPRQALSGQFGFAEKGKGRPEVILSEDVFVELGHPATASITVVLTTYDAGLVEDGAVTVVGPDLDGLSPRGRNPFAQVMILALDKSRMPDPFDLENTQYLMHRLPGYMVRSVPGRLWVRVGKKQHAGGLNLHVVGSALNMAYTGDFPGVIRAETVFVTSGSPDVEALEQIAAEARILSGKHKKLVLGVDGSVECSELNCEECEEKPVCDNLRDVVVQRRKQRKTRA